MTGCLESGSSLAYRQLDATFDALVPALTKVLERAVAGEDVRVAHQQGYFTFVSSDEAVVTIVGDETAASQLGVEHDVLLAEGEEVEVAEILEDELLMAMPDQLCREEPCERMMPREFPAPGGATESAAERGNPFAAIAKLKD